MDRAADYTIQGFLYQFNKTLLEVLKSNDDSEINVEGIIEDIEIVAPSGVKLIQCKYHEAKISFTISTIYKPLLQMMQHFQDNQQASVSYMLFAHFPNPPSGCVVTRVELEAALASKNKEFKKYCDALTGKIDLDNFLRKFTIEFGPSWNDMVASVHSALVDAGIAKGDVDVLAYPNAIQSIANLSINHDVSKRKIKKSALLHDLNQIKSTAISQWTLAAATRKKVLEARRKQLKSHLDLNSRARCLVVNCSAILDFDKNIVGFVCDFLAKYHFKISHQCTPTLCLDSTAEVFRDVQLRLYKKGVVSNDGCVGPHFDKAHFYRQPLVVKSRPSNDVKKEFNLRILHWESNGQILDLQQVDDLFILGKDSYSLLISGDVCVEVLEVSSLKEISFITGIDQTYE